MPRNTEKYPLDFKKIVRGLYRTEKQGRDTYCKDCQNIEHHIFVNRSEVKPHHPTGLICVNCCALFDE